jgi:hypothetical protein
MSQERCVTRRSIRAESWYYSRETLSGAKGHGASLPAGRQGGYGACFCSPGTEFCGYYECRGTNADK